MSIATHNRPRAVVAPHGGWCPTGLTLPDSMTFPEWQRLGDELKRLRDSSLRWWWGDWLRFGEWRYGEQYSQAVEAGDYSYQSHANSVWVCSRIELSRRRENLSFSHHQEVAALSAAEQDMWLADAEANGWSHKTLREMIAQTRKQAAPGVAGDTERVFDPCGDWALSESESPEEEGCGPSPILAPAPPANPHAVHHSSESPEWYTPRSIIDAVIAFFDAIDLDPCSNSAESPNVPAVRHFTQADDGLHAPWFGRVYMNPPYGREIGPWVRRAVDSYQTREIEAAILLVPARTDTEWFRQVRDFPVCFVNGRVRFISPDGEVDAAPFPSALVYLGDELDRFAASFAHLGDVWARYQGGQR